MHRDSLIGEEFRGQFRDWISPARLVCWDCECKNVFLVGIVFPLIVFEQVQGLFHERYSFQLNYHKCCNT